MARQIIKIDSILGGISAGQYLGGKGTYNSALGIDLDFPDPGSGIKTSGMIYPVGYSKFSGTEFTGHPMFIMANPKTNNTIIYSSDGKIHSFDSSLAMRATDEASTALPISITGGAGNGAAYYNNYYYFAENTDISRYGGMDQGVSIAKTENVWTGATLGSQTALTNISYPTIQGVEMPNHPMHVHVDGNLYVGDVSSSTNQGIIHKIRTKTGSHKGDTDEGSAYNVLDLPFGYLPTDIESFGSDLVISAIQTTDTNINQGKGALFFWDTISSSFYRQVPISDPLVTALLNHNGILYVWSGNSQDGCRLSVYMGGEQLQDIAYLEEGAPPLCGAIDALGNRIVWGGYTSYPEASACVYAWGSKDLRFGKGLHNVVKSSSAGTTPLLSALAYIQQSSNKQPNVVVGWGDDSAKGLDKYSGSATLGAVFRTSMFNVNRPFSVERVIVSLPKAVAANMTITVKAYIDDLSSNVSLTTINNTNYSNSERRIILDPGSTPITGVNNFLLEFKNTGTVALPLLLPIEIIIQTEKP